ncbi:MAG: amidohydrolase [SAR86 cluster bacterium]|jgi:amidohydrolase|uniref:Amidohydrolase n=1 Tax=SAR86 cluster bacterium TaxID=2030880 RepID=A0A520MPT2_9GAMM|nr:MAG: amidohydrolase [SAR86 cluster bacterium]|tara:strand:- start:601 stop:1869 length:1269 start_codon:yes stop_codon:yes gene_type:complete
MIKLILFFCLLFTNAAYSDLKRDLDNQLEPLMDKVIEWRHDIHQNPELGNREFRTAKKVADHLSSLDIEVETGIAYTGVVGLLKGGLPGPTVALRADMDALPVVEKTGLPYASKVTTTYLGNEVGVMHACGHDAHVSILMGVAEFFAKNRSKVKGNIMFIFQPAEEGPPEGENGGAKMMLEEGIFEKYNPEVIFGLHVSNGPHGYVGFAPGPAMAAASAWRVTINGVQSHGSRPWEGIDPIMALSQFINQVNTIVSRRVNIVGNPAVVSVGMIEAGTRNNIIPEEATMMGTIRTFDPELRKKIYQEISQIAKGVETATGTSIKVEFDVGGFYPVTFNNIALGERMKQSLIEASNGNFAEISRRTGAEDFSYFSQEIPGLYIFLGVNDPDKMNQAGNHSPYFTVNDEALDEGLRSLIYMTIDY